MSELPPFISSSRKLSSIETQSNHIIQIIEELTLAAASFLAQITALDSQQRQYQNDLTELLENVDQFLFTSITFSENDRPRNSGQFDELPENAFHSPLLSLNGISIFLILYARWDL
jgi:hypothetical protein